MKYEEEIKPNATDVEIDWQTSLERHTEKCKHAELHAKTQLLLSVLCRSFAEPQQSCVFMFAGIFTRNFSACKSISRSGCYMLSQNPLRSWAKLSEVIWLNHEQKLNVSDNIAVYVKFYRLPQSQKKEKNNQFKALREKELSTSSYNSPLIFILVPKKSTDGKPKWRMCVDYRMLNRKLIPDKFPLSRIEEILDGLGRAK